MTPVSKCTSQEEDDDQSGEDVSIKLRVTCAEDDIKPLLGASKIPRYDYAESMFHISFLKWTAMLA